MDNSEEAMEFDSIVLPGSDNCLISEVELSTWGLPTAGCPKSVGSAFCSVKI